MSLPDPAAGHTCVVTGASSGIGAEIARALARRGHDLTLVARREDRLTDLADEVGGRDGVSAEVITADLADHEGRVALLSALTERDLIVDLLVNNAGVSTTGRVCEAEPERDLTMIRLDVEAVVHLTSALLPGMVQQGEGGVINVASTAAFQPLPGQAGYGGSKAFVLSYTQAIGQELRGTNVTATALCPGPVRTEFAEVAGFDPTDAEGSLPEVMWLDAADVAEKGVAGFASGRTVVVPGPANRALSIVAQHTPRTLLLRLVGRRHPALRDEA